jgi:hypothetical protein
VVSGGSAVIRVSERLVGPVALGADTPRLGAARGGAAILRAALELAIPASTDDVRTAGLAGTVSWGDVADHAPIEGEVELFVPDPETGMKQIRYRAAFRARDGGRRRLEATTFVRPGRATWREQRRAYARVLAPASPDADGLAPGEPTVVVAAGILTLRLRDVPRLVWSAYAGGGARVFRYLRRELATPVPMLAS